MLRTDFGYSEAEMKLITYFDCEVLSKHMSPYTLYHMMAEQAFMQRDLSWYADSVRRCLESWGKIDRLTLEWDELIHV